MVSPTPLPPLSLSPSVLVQDDVPMNVPLRCVSIDLPCRAASSTCCSCVLQCVYRDGFFFQMYTRIQVTMYQMKTFGRNSTISMYSNNVMFTLTNVWGRIDVAEICLRKYS